VYIVNNEQLGQAIGKNGMHATKIRTALGKHVQIIGFKENPVEFTKSFISSVEPKSISLEEKETEKHIIIEADYKSRGSIHGKRGKKLKILKELLKRHHNVDDVLIR